MHRNSTPRNSRTISIHNPDRIESPMPREQQINGPERLPSSEYDRLLSPYHSLLQNGRMTFSEFVKTRFIPEHVSPKGVAGKRFYQSILKQILNPETVGAMFNHSLRGTNGRLTSLPGWPYLDDVRLCELSVDHVKAIVFAALKKGYSLQTVKHIRSVTGKIIDHAIKRGCFTGENPAFQVPLPNAIRRPAWRLSLTYAKQVLGRMQEPERQMALIAMLTGLSLVEMCALQWKQVNVTDLPHRLQRHFLPPRTMAVYSAWKSGKFRDAKRNRIKNIPIPELPLALLRKLNATGPYPNPEDFVFTSPTGTALLPEELTNSLTRLGNELGMPWISWRLFTKAHTFMTRADGDCFLRQSDVVPSCWY